MKPNSSVYHTQTSYKKKKRNNKFHENSQLSCCSAAHMCFSEYHYRPHQNNLFSLDIKELLACTSVDPSTYHDNIYYTLCYAWLMLIVPVAHTNRDWQGPAWMGVEGRGGLRGSQTIPPPQCVCKLNFPLVCLHSTTGDCCILHYYVHVKWWYSGTVAHCHRYRGTRHLSTVEYRLCVRAPLPDAMRLVCAVHCESSVKDASMLMWCDFNPERRHKNTSAHWHTLYNMQCAHPFTHARLNSKRYAFQFIHITHTHNG